MRRASGRRSPAYRGGHGRAASGLSLPLSNSAIPRSSGYYWNAAPIPTGLRDRPRREAPRLHAASRTGDRAILELLLAHGADPNSYIDSSGSATYVAATAESAFPFFSPRAGLSTTYDLMWLGEDDEVVRRVAEDPRTANYGCGGVLAAACTQGKHETLVRLLKAGARVPPVLTECRSYLLSDPAMLRLLLESGMDPNQPNWLLATPLHDLCGRDGRGRSQKRRVSPVHPSCSTPAPTFPRRDEDYRSTPLAWAARNNLLDMVELLLARGAPTNLPDDEPWATPLTWATRRGHKPIVDLLVAAGARS